MDRQVLLRLNRVMKVAYVAVDIVSTQTRNGRPSMVPCPMIPSNGLLQVSPCSLVCTTNTPLVGQPASCLES